MRTRMMRLLVPLALLWSLTSLPAAADEPRVPEVGLGSGYMVYSPSIGWGESIQNPQGTGNYCSYDTLYDLWGTDAYRRSDSLRNGGVWLLKSRVGIAGAPYGYELATLDACGLLGPAANVTDPGWDPTRHGPIYCSMMGQSGVGFIRFEGGGGKLRLFDLGWQSIGAISGFYQEYDTAGVPQDRWGTITITRPQMMVVTWLKVSQCPVWDDSAVITLTPLTAEP